MQIQTNTMSLFGQRKLAENSSSLDRSLQRLSSGLRINSAKDDAARLAISERMTAQVRGSDQARRGVNDSVSMLQVADGALGNVASMLQRMRELAVQAANGTLSAGDRQALQKEVSALVAGIDQIGAQTEFNGQQVFEQGRSGVGGDASRRAVLDGLRLGWLEESENRIRDFFGIEADGQQELTVNLNFSDPDALAAISNTSYDANGRGQGLSLNIDMSDFTPPNLPDGGSAPFYNDRVIAHEMVHAVMLRSMDFQQLRTDAAWFTEGIAEFIHGADERLVNDGALTAGGRAAIMAQFNTALDSSLDYSAGFAAVRYMHDRIKQAGGEGVKDILVYLSENTGATLDQALTNASHGAFAGLTTGGASSFNSRFAADGAAYLAAMNLTNADTGAIGGADADGGAVLTAKDVLLDTGTRYGESVLEGFKLKIPEYMKNAGQRFVELQVGYRDTDRVSIGITAANAGALGVADVDVSTLPQFALVHIDEAIDAVATGRARIGAALSRLEASSENLANRSENLQAARSRMRDADFAEETAALTRDQILRQSATAMVAMANTQPQRVLSLLS